LGLSATDISRGLEASGPGARLVTMLRDVRAWDLTFGFRMGRISLARPASSSSNVIDVVLGAVISVISAWRIGTSDEISVPWVLGGVSVFGDSMGRRGEDSLSGSEMEIDMSARRRVLFLLSALLLDRMGSPSSSNDLFELELRWDEVTEGLLARYLSLSCSNRFSWSFLLF